MDYAIFRSGNKQYKVRLGTVIDVDKLTAEEGSYLEINDVLAVSRDGNVVIGNPVVPDATVVAQVESQAKDKKILVFKYKRKVRYRRKMGHRQQYTRLAITSILLGGEEIGISEQTETTPPIEDVLVVAGEEELEAEEELEEDETVTEEESGSEDQLEDGGADDSEGPESAEGSESPEGEES